MVSPSHTCASTDELKFWYYHDHTTSYYNYSGVWISTTGSDPTLNPGDYTEIQELNATAPGGFSEAAWTEFVYSLSAYSGQTIYIAFKYTGDWDHELYIDDFSIDVATTCFPPTALNATTLTTTSAQLNWAVPTTGTPLDYIWEVQPQGIAQGTAGALTSGSALTTLTTNTGNVLLANTSYTFYIQTNCGSSDSSAWVSYDFATPCSSVMSPYSQNFDGTTEPDIDACWSTIKTASTSSMFLWTDDTPTPNSPLNSVRLYNSWVLAGSGELILISPMFSDFDNTKRIRFHLLDYNHQSDLIIGTMSDPSDATTFIAFDTIPFSAMNHLNWEEHTVTFDSYSGTDNYIAFKHGMNAVYNSLYIDDFVYEDIPACVNPTALNVSNITAMTAQLNWTASISSGAVDYNWEIQPQGTAQGGATPIASGTGASSGVIASGLSATTDYVFYVQTNCGGSGTSTWVTGINFTTTCAVETPYYIEDFTTYLNPCWEEATGSIAGPTAFGSSNWQVDGFGNVGATGSARTNIFGSGGEEWLLTPMFNLSAGGYEINLDVALTSFSGTSSQTINVDDAVHIVQSIDGGTTWTSIYDWGNTNSPSNTGENVTIDISTVTSATTKFAIFVTEGSTSGGDMNFFVDNFAVRTVPSCANPTALNVTNITTMTAQLNWTASLSSGAVDYNWEIQPQGTAQGGATPIASGTGASSGVIASGLSATTDYVFYVQTNCGGSGTSTWSGPYSFSTPCTPYTATYTQNFDGVSATAIDACWSTIKNVSGTTNELAQSSTLRHVSSPNSVQLYNSGGTSGDLILVSPMLSDLNNTKRIVFQVYEDDSGSDLIIGTMSDPSDATTFTTVHTIAHADMTQDIWEEHIVNFNTFIGTDKFIAFKHGLGSTYDRIYLDDFVYEEIPACVSPTVLNVNNVTTISAQLNWTASASTGAVDYNWEIQPQGTAQGGATPIANGTGASSGVVATGLSANTNYDLFVQTNCGSDSSVWEGPFTFSTSCAAVTAPYLQNFDATTAPAVDVCWTILEEISGTTNEFIRTSTAYPNAYSANNSIKMFNSNSTTGDLIFVSPEFSDFDNNKRIVFYAYDKDNGSDLVIGTMSDPSDVSTFTAYQTITFASMGDDVWEEHIVNFDTYVGTDNYVAFKHGANSNYDYLLIDDFIYEEIPSCLIPTNITLSNVTADSVQLNWTNSTSTNASTYNWEIQLQGIAQGSVAPVASGTASMSGVVASGLSASTDYTLYVQTNCGTIDGNSTWNNLDFNTPCAVVTPNHIQDFSTFLPNCWEQATDGTPTTGPSGLGTSQWQAEEFAHVGSGLGAVDINLYHFNRREWLLSPYFDLSAGNYQISLDVALTSYNNTSPDNMGSDDEVQLLYTEDGTTWINITTWNTSNQPSTAGQTFTTPLLSTATNVRFAIWANDGTVNDSEDYDFHIDNFIINCQPIVNPTTIPMNLCSGDTFTLNTGTFVTNGGMINDTLTASSACDSIITYNFTLLMPTVSIVDTAICQGTTLTLANGTVITTSGIYEEVYVNSVNCDSTVTFNVTVNTASSSLQDIYLCDGASFTLPMSGTVVTVANTYMDTTMNANGCDSIITYNVATGTSTADTFEIGICSGANYTLPSGTVVSTAGTYSETLTSIIGCDSIVTFNITINAGTSSSQTIHLCDGDSFTLPISGTEVFVANTYLETTTNSLGCDSIITFVVTTGMSSTDTINANICTGETYILVDGTIVTTGGTYTAINTNNDSCDNVITYNIIENTPTASSVVDTACETYTWAIDGNTYTVSGIYSYTTVNAVNCDSIITLDLTINDTTASTDVITVCDSLIWIDGITYTTNNNSATHTSTNSVGCTHVTTLDLTISAMDENKSDTICQGNEYQFGTQTLSDAGVYTETFTNTSGCEYDVTLTLTVNIVNSSTVEVLLCGNQLEFTLENGTVITEEGTYTEILVDDNGCDEIVTYQVSTCVSIFDIENNIGITLYPNPTSELLNVVFSEKLSNMNNVSILNILGQSIYELSNTDKTFIQINTSDFTDGIYYLNIKSDNKTSVKTFTVLK